MNLNASYMFTKMIGIYGGISDTLYAPVFTKTTTTVNNHDDTVRDSNTSGKLANSFSMKVGLRFVF